MKQKRLFPFKMQTSNLPQKYIFFRKNETFEDLFFSGFPPCGISLLRLAKVTAALCHFWREDPFPRR